MTTVLVVEDERDIREVLRRYLERADMSVITTGSGAEALSLLTSPDLDVVILDLGLPDIDGLEVLREARRLGGLRILVLTARSEVEDRITGLEAGADDYVTKPFSPREVVLRVQAIAERAVAAAPPRQNSYGGNRLHVDDERHEARLDDRLLDLTPSEWGILAALCGHPGRVYSRYELVNRVRGYEFSGYERSIDSHVKNLRNKLSPEGMAIIETVTGVGYRLGWARDERPSRCPSVVIADTPGSQSDSRRCDRHHRRDSRRSTGNPARVHLRREHQSNANRPGVGNGRG